MQIVRNSSRLARRAEEKQESRDRDASLIASGEASVAQIRRRNSLFSLLPLERYSIVAIGDEKVEIEFSDRAV